MIELIIFFGGCLVGVIATVVVIFHKKAGTLCFYDMEPPEPPAMTAILDMPAEDIHKRKYAVFNVSRR